MITTIVQRAKRQSSIGTFEATGFNGSDQYLSNTDDTGYPLSIASFLLSWWFKRSAHSGSLEVMFSAQDNAATKFLLRIEASGKLRLQGLDGGGTTRLDVTGSTAITDTDRHHLLFSYDTSDVANKRHFYLDDVDDSPTWTTLSTTQIPFGSLANPKYGIAARHHAPDLHAAVAMGHNWLHAGSTGTAYLDLDSTPNRRKFITAALDPASVGSNGQNPLGSAPLIYMPNCDGTNAGSTANFTRVNNPPLTSI